MRDGFTPSSHDFSADGKSSVFTMSLSQSATTDPNSVAAAALATRPKPFNPEVGRGLDDNAEADHEERNGWNEDEDEDLTMKDAKDKSVVRRYGSE